MRSGIGAEDYLTNLEEMEGHYLHDFTFRFDNDNQLTTDFTIEVTEVGADTEREGLTEIISYYELEFGSVLRSLHPRPRRLTSLCG